MTRIEDTRARVIDAYTTDGKADHMEKILVTGATGHLGLAVVRCLLEHGYTTYAAARANSVHRLAPLRSTDAEVVPLDVTDTRQVDRAIAGMDGVIHVAAAHTVVTSSDAAPVRAAIESGTKNILHACKRHGVRKLVLTSSAAATGTALPHEPARDERDWNGTTTDPYLRAKTDAEANAWAFAQAHGLQLAAVLPSAIIGPGFYRHTPTTQFFAEMVHNKIPFVAPLMFNFVDVRDVARARHCLCKRRRARPLHRCGRLSDAGRVVRNAAHLIVGYTHSRFAVAASAARPDTRQRLAFVSPEWTSTRCHPRTARGLRAASTAVLDRKGGEGARLAAPRTDGNLGGHAWMATDP